MWGVPGVSGCGACLDIVCAVCPWWEEGIGDRGEVVLCQFRGAGSIGRFVQVLWACHRVEVHGVRGGHRCKEGRWSGNGTEGGDGCGHVWWLL